MLGFHPISAAPISALRTLQTPDVVDSCYDTNLYDGSDYQLDVDVNVDHLSSQIFSVDDVVSSYDASAEESLEADVDGDQLSAEVFNTPAAVADDIIPSSYDPDFEEIFEDQDNFYYVIEADVVVAVDVIASSYESDFEDPFEDQTEVLNQPVDDNSIVGSFSESNETQDYSDELFAPDEFYYVIEADVVVSVDFIDGSYEYDYEEELLAPFDFVDGDVIEAGVAVDFVDSSAEYNYDEEDPAPLDFVSNSATDDAPIQPDFIDSYTVDDVDLDVDLDLALTLQLQGLIEADVAVVADIIGSSFEYDSALFDENDVEALYPNVQGQIFDDAPIIPPVTPGSAGQFGKTYVISGRREQEPEPHDHYVPIKREPFDVTLQPPDQDLKALRDRLFDLGRQLERKKQAVKDRIKVEQAQPLSPELLLIMQRLIDEYELELYNQNAARLLILMSEL